MKTDKLTKLGWIAAIALVTVWVGSGFQEGANKIGAFMDQKPEGFATLDEVADALSGARPGPDGLGLALPACKAIVEAHDGRLWYESGSPGGSVFRVSLPLATARTVMERLKKKTASC